MFKTPALRNCVPLPSRTIPPIAPEDDRITKCSFLCAAWHKISAQAENIQLPPIVILSRLRCRPERSRGTSQAVETAGKPGDSSTRAARSE